MDESDTELSGMSKPASVACLSKKSINSLFQFTLSSTVILAFIYILVFIVQLITRASFDDVYLVIGYISLIAFISVPFGYYGSLTSGYCALFTFIIVASYHLYGLLFYIYQYIEDLAKDSVTISYTLHRTSAITYTCVICLSIIMASLAILVKAKQIEPAKVIVFDNNSTD